ncbi:tripartite tricarboxylate transporter substrate binding protein [Metabacillus arenae]|uniref:Tripartite tricarboxylate transporter substrate binding protein n=1 Tax=Metabacillus arenae TaxID=2771434 RepID=A0A926S0Z9_9BACI|nr:tripartite tricarboxylate transporter substrate binding protein [Metabacillus arenae]MBD1380524.1 tripartite tricarboxylate transporter substrate binding protein [Metabacillus arenae]
MKKVLVLMISFLLLTSCFQKNENSEVFPSKDLHIIASASPGGGWDRTARSIKRVLSEAGITKQSITVENKPGGGGEVGWRYLQNQNSNAISVNSSLLLTNHLLGQSQLTYEDFTPLAILATEWISVTVNKESKIQTTSDLISQLKRDPKSLKVGIAPGLGNGDQLSFVQILKKAGVDPADIDFVVYDSGGEIVNALLEGKIDVITTAVSEVEEHHQEGNLQILAVSSEKRIEGLEDVPTWTEEGIEIVFPHWRGIMGPPDMKDEEVSYWNDVIEEMVKTEEWKEILKNNEWNNFYKNSDQAKEFLKEQNKLYYELLNDSGLL